MVGYFLRLFAYLQNWVLQQLHLVYKEEDYKQQYVSLSC